ncbi:MAG: FABP family protein [Bowdeniella nasicola]|nr:FABP family protein [Bowdeniella nasicola]
MTTELGPEVRPLAFLHGTWRGWGIGAAYGLEDQPLIYRLTIDHDGGPYLRADAEIAIGHTASGVIDAAAGPAEGYRQLEQTALWGVETLYLRIPPAVVGMSEGPIPVEGMLADPAGFVAVLAGNCATHALALESTALHLTPSGANVTALQREFLLNSEDHLLVRARLAAFGEELGEYWTCQLERVLEGCACGAGDECGGCGKDGGCGCCADERGCGCCADEGGCACGGGSSSPQEATEAAGSDRA